MTEASGSGSVGADGAIDPAVAGIHRLVFEQISSAVAIGETIFDDAGKPIDFRVATVNPAFERLTNRRAEDVIGQHALDLAPRMGPGVFEQMLTVALTGQPAQLERHNLEPDRHLVINLARVGPTLVMAIIEDVTEKRRAEAEIRERTAFMDTIIASAGEGMIVYDRDLRLVVWNPTMEELTGMPSAKVLGGGAFELFPDVMATGVGEDLKRALGGETPTSREFEYVIPGTGRRGWVVQTNRPHRNAADEIVGVVSSVRDITARHEIDEALRRSEAEFRAIFDSVADGAAIHDPNGRLLEVNQVLCERLGYTREQLLTMNIRDINTAAMATLLPSRVQQAMGGTQRVFQTTHVRRDGSEIPIEVVARRIEFRGQQAIVSVHRDMTEQKRAEGALREQARFLQQLLDAIPVPIVAKDLDGRIRLTNSAFMEAAGRERQIIGKTVAELGMPEPAAHAEHDRILLAGGPSQIYELSLRFADGSTRRQLLTKAALRTASADITGIVTASIDITDRYNAEQALRKSEERFRSLFESAVDAIFMVDPATGRFVEVNPAACNWLGYTREELLLLTPMDVDTPEFAATFPARLRTIVERGKLAFETALRRRDGVTIPVELSATMVELEGRLTMLGIARDLTERRQAETQRAALEEQLRQSQKMEGIGRLAGGIAHDFNNLLTAIRGSASLALAELPPGDGPREDLEQIEQAADRAAALTRQLLAFARRTVLQPEVVNLGAIVRHVKPMLERLIGEDVTLVTVTPDGTGSVLADPGQIEQVIVNLALNARDAMPDGGTMTIEVADSAAAGPGEPPAPSLLGGRMTTLSVTDTGIGMSAETVEHAFEPFFTTKDLGKGTGLGLATVYGIVHASDGIVTVHSEPGRGSTFTVHLPRIEAPAGAVAEPQASPSRVATRIGTILVVEDDSGVRRFTSRVLETAGYRVLTASDGAAAIALSRKEQVQLLLTDVVMPGIRGPEVAKRLMATQPGIRVLYMSGHTDKGIVHNGILQPDIEFLPKPFTPAALLAAVDAAMAEADSNRVREIRPPEPRIPS